MTSKTQQHSFFNKIIIQNEMQELKKNHKDNHMRRKNDEIIKTKLNIWTQCFFCGIHTNLSKELKMNIEPKKIMWIHEWHPNIVLDAIFKIPFENLSTKTNIQIVGVSICII